MDPLPLSPAWMRTELELRDIKHAEVIRYLNDGGSDIDAAKFSKAINNRRKFKDLELYLISKFLGRSDDQHFYDMRMLMLDGQRDATPEQIERLKREEGGTHRSQVPLPNAGLPEPLPRRASGTLPILGQSLGGGPDTRVQFNGQRLGEIDVPSKLADVPNAYATFVHGTSMEPRYEAGELVLVNPQKPIRKGCFVVAQVYENDQDPPYGYVKKFIQFNDSHLVLEQLNPPHGEDAIMSFPRNRVVSVHRIVGSLDE